MILLRYKTSYWIPPIAEITLRTERNDWKDLPGRYEEGGWTFELRAETFAGTWEAKLVLDGAVWMNDPNLTFTVAEGETHEILAGAVRLQRSASWTGARIWTAAAPLFRAPSRSDRSAL